MFRLHVLAFCIGLPLLSCVSTTPPPLRVVDCTQGAYCRTFHEWPERTWSKQHEALYWRGVRSVLREMACGRMVARGRKLAYVADDELSVSCANSHAQVRHVKDRDDGKRLLNAGRIDYLVEFERADASNVNGGIQVPLSLSYYGRSRKAGADPRLEEVDSYVILQTDTMSEVRLVSKAAL